MSTAGLNRDFIGRDYAGEALRVEAPDMAAFARAIHDDNPAYNGDDMVAHPLFPVRLLRGLMPGILTDEALGCDMTALVHGEQAYTYHRPIRPGDVVQLEGTIREIEDKHSGQVLRIEQRLVVDDQVAVTGHAAAFIRGSGPCPPKVPSTENPTPFRPESVGLLHTAINEIDPAQAQRYADASGDHNPIHLDEDVARRAGLPGVILHGTCTLALSARAVVDGVLGGDPGRLRSLAVRFTRPVLVPDRVTTEIWTAGPDRLRLETKNRAGQTVLAHGEVEWT